MKETIQFYLNQYDIFDNNYLQNCIQAYDTLLEKHLMNKFNEIHHTLFCEQENYMKYWMTSNINDLFNEQVHPYTTNLLLLSGLKYHQQNMEKYHFDEKQITLHKKRMHQILTNDIYVKKLDGLRMSQLVWGTYFIHANIIECGCLQFEKANKNKFTQENIPSIDIHIPANTSLKKSDVIQSILDSKQLIKKYYNLENIDYTCISWMLSSQVNQLLNENSNIKQFTSLFEIKEAISCKRDILNFVFNVRNIDDYTLLSEKTSLQRLLKTELLQGKDFNYGVGRVNFEMLGGNEND